MVKNNYLKLSLLILVIGILFAGCTANNTDKMTTDKNTIKVESDESNQVTGQEEVTVKPADDKTIVEETTDNELVTSDDVEIGKLI